MSPRAARRRHRAARPLRVKAALAGTGVLTLAVAWVAGADLFRSQAGGPGATALAVAPAASSASPPAPDPGPAASSAAPATSTPPPAPETSKAPVPSPSTKKPAPIPSKAPTKKAAPAPVTAQAEQRPPTAQTGSTQSAEVVRLVNLERAAAGCPVLQADQDLTEAAQGHSDSMAATKNFAHTGTDGSQPQDRVEAAGYEWSRSGENIAMGQPDAAAVVDAWMNSPGHRANILNCEFTEIGVGVNSNGGPWWTQSFGTPA
ncbi:CAP domain-containing protein [Streptomyces sp. H27-H1]|uniref:CAP domain-containing protein n=1 Tax=Streptomyces sp. H27-H1 TaxID=2996461 RepID=UPI00226E70C3|nr:CAP domain-containing protein [Streptomyces sp. H27-H1]MCY0932295.1 CAP domain-containing protein [Streptomyces sp. H27-H1]